MPMMRGDKSRCVPQPSEPGYDPERDEVDWWPDWTGRYWVGQAGRCPPVGAEQGAAAEQEELVALLEQSEGAPLCEEANIPVPAQEGVSWNRFVQTVGTAYTLSGGRWPGMERLPGAGEEASECLPRID